MSARIKRPAAGRADKAARDARYAIEGMTFEAAPPAPGLYLVATPIGNLKDITLRALETLAAADVILAEDTRVTRRLLSHFGIRTRTRAYHDHNEDREQAAIMAMLHGGGVVALVSDAGTPIISDPGFKLARQAAADGIAVVPVPGPASPLAALVASGLPSDRFYFEGFLPPKRKARRDRLSELSDIPGTLLFFESPRRLADSLADMADILGERDAAVLRELTKLHEEARRGQLADLARGYAGDGPPKGEVVIAVGPAAPRAEPAPEDLDALLGALLANLSIRDAAREAARLTGVTRGTAYRRALQIQPGGTSNGD